MKDGIFQKLKSVSPLLLSLFFLQGCASFLEVGEPADNPADFDRGYSRDPASASAGVGESRELADSDTVDAAQGLSYEQRRIKRAIEMRDVVLGMTRHDVMESWGQPAQREVAGRGTGGHERWTFGSRYSLSGSRTVIFENGKVAGWSH